MAECTVSHQMLRELYEEIYKLHWSYLELEEVMQKLEEQKALEGLLKKFLCIVPHNRKFLLPETYNVFKRTITQMKDFSVVKMLNGFESISQYANNLFTKPWRKEYRTIKMYSGFFIHEIKSNLVDPEELFIAMGYKKTASPELVLDGEICPDQVMNMSRDAMTAYTECKILNRIYLELTTTYNISCTWLDVFNYREQHTGGVSETIEAIRNLSQQNVYAIEKQLGPCFSSQQPPYVSNGVLPAATAGGQQQCNKEQHFGGNVNYHPASACAQQGPSSQLPTMSHHHHHHHHHNASSYEQQPPVDLMTNSYDSSYCQALQQQQQHHSLNGSLSSANVAMSAGNVPAVISQNTPTAGVYGMHPQLGGPYSSSGHSNHNMRNMSNVHLDHPHQGFYAPQNQNNLQTPRHLHQQAQQANFCDYAPHTALPHSKSLDHYSYPTVLGEHLQHRSLDQPHHHHHPPQQLTHDPYEGHGGTGISSGGQFSRNHGNMNGVVGSNNYYEAMPASSASNAAAYNVSGTRYPLPYSVSAQFGATTGGVEGTGQWGGYCGLPAATPSGILMNSPGAAIYPQNDHLIHGQNHSRGGVSLPRNGAPQYYSDLIKPPVDHPQLVGGYGESSDEVDRQQPHLRATKMIDQQQQTPRTSDFDSYEEFFGDQSKMGVRAIRGGHHEGAAALRSSSISNKNSTRDAPRTNHKPRPDKIQDGVGSFESWDYVYQSLDQDQATRRPSVAELPTRQASNGRATLSSKEASQKSKTMTRQEANTFQEHISNLRAVKPTTTSGDAAGGEGRRSSGGHRKSNSIGENVAVGKAAAAAASLTVNGHHQRQVSDSALNGGHRISRSNGGVGKREVARVETSAEASPFPVESLPPPVITQDEWSCRFCTFLNESSRRICEMCAKSKDFVLDGSSAATCV